MTRTYEIERQEKRSAPSAIAIIIGISMLYALVGGAELIMSLVEIFNK